MQMEALAYVCTFVDGAPLDALEHDGLAAYVGAAVELEKRSLVSFVAEEQAATRVKAYRDVRCHVEQRTDSLRETRWRQHAQTVLRLAGSLERGASVADLYAHLYAELGVIQRRFFAQDASLAARESLAMLPADLGSARAQQLRRELAMLAPRVERGLRARVHVGLAQLCRRLGHLEQAQSLVCGVHTFDAYDVEALLEQAHLDRQASQFDDALRGYQTAVAAAHVTGNESLQCLA